MIYEWRGDQHTQKKESFFFFSLFFSFPFEKVVYNLSIFLCVYIYIHTSPHVYKKSIESPMCGPLSDQLNIEMLVAKAKEREREICLLCVEPMALYFFSFFSSYSFLVYFVVASSLGLVCGSLGLVLVVVSFSFFFYAYRRLGFFSLTFRSIAGQREPRSIWTRTHWNTSTQRCSIYLCFSNFEKKKKKRKPPPTPFKKTNKTKTCNNILSCLNVISRIKVLFVGGCQTNGRTKEDVKFLTTNEGLDFSIYILCVLWLVCIVKEEKKRGWGWGRGWWGIFGNLVVTVSFFKYIYICVAFLRLLIDCVCGWSFASRDTLGWDILARFAPERRLRSNMHFRINFTSGRLRWKGFFFFFSGKGEKVDDRWHSCFSFFGLRCTFFAYAYA